ncbi:MAG: proline-rich domain-containing protein, partial [Planctomycetota bacterium]
MILASSRNIVQPLLAVLLLSILVAPAKTQGPPANTQGPPANTQGPPANTQGQGVRPPVADDGFIPAQNLLPNSTAGLVRSIDFPGLCDAWQRTSISKLADEPAMEPLLEAYLGDSGLLLERFQSRVGLRPKDLYDLATGEVAIGWLPFPNDARMPTAMCIIADIRGNEEATQAVVDRIDRELTEDGATRKDVSHRGATIQVYQPKTKPGQLRIEQIAIMHDGERIIASDRESVVKDVVSALKEGVHPSCLACATDFEDVSRQLDDRFAMDLDAGRPDAKSTLRWFVRPIAMARIVRDLAKVDRGKKIRVVDLLEKQGFDAVAACGGIVTVGDKEFDLLHRGFILAPP